MSEHAEGPSEGSCRLPDQQPARRWRSLAHRERGEVRSMDSFRYAAYVDDLSEDGRLIWAIQEGAGSRRFFVHGDLVTRYSI